VYGGLVNVPTGALFAVALPSVLRFNNQVSQRVKLESDEQSLPVATA